MEPGLNGRGHCQRAVIAVLRVPLEANPDRAVELGRDVRADLRDRLDLVLLLLQRQLGQRPVLVR